MTTEDDLEAPEAETDKDRPIKRRSIIRNAGVGLAALTTVGSAAAKPPETSNPTQNESAGGNESGDPGEVTPEYIAQWSADFSPSQIDVSDTSELRCEWEVTGTDYYQLDVVVESDRISQPSTSATNIGGVTKEWEHTSSSPVGPAYHFQSKGVLYAPTTTTYYVESIVDPYSTGPVTANSGTYWPIPQWYSATLYVE